MDILKFFSRSKLYANLNFTTIPSIAKTVGLCFLNRFWWEFLSFSRAQCLLSLVSCINSTGKVTLSILVSLDVETSVRSM